MNNTNTNIIYINYNMLYLTCFIKRFEEEIKDKRTYNDLNVFKAKADRKKIDKLENIVYIMKNLKHLCSMYLYSGNDIKMKISDSERLIDIENITKKLLSHRNYFQKISDRFGINAVDINKYYPQFEKNRYLSINEFPNVLASIRKDALVAKSRMVPDRKKKK